MKTLKLGKKLLVAILMVNILFTTIFVDISIIKNTNTVYATDSLWGDPCNYTAEINGISIPFDGYKNGVRWQNSSKYYDSSKEKYVNFYASQCMGFARFVFYKLFDVNESTGYAGKHKAVVSNVAAKDISVAYLKNIFGTIVLPGAHIRTGDSFKPNKDGKYTQHSIIYIGHDDDYIYTYDANNDGQNGIYVRRYKWSVLCEYLKTKKNGIAWIHMPIPYPCQHKDIKNGKCQDPDCDYVYDHDATINYSSAGIYKSSSNTYTLRKTPYEEVFNTIRVSMNWYTSIDDIIFPKVLGTVKNQVNESTQEEWYKVKVGANYGYVKINELEKVSNTRSKIFYKGIDKPKDNHIKGKSYKLHGTIVSESPLSYVTGYVTNKAGYAKGDNIIQQSRHIFVRSNTYNMYGSNVCNGLKFGSYPVGTYYYYIETGDIHGNVELSPEQSFNVVENFMTIPRIKLEDYFGGKRLIISPSTPGTTACYKIGNITGSTQSSFSLPMCESESLTVWSTKGSSTSAKERRNIEIYRTTPPTIYSRFLNTLDNLGLFVPKGETVELNGKQVVITSDYGAKIFYSIDDGEYITYSKPFEVTNNCTIKTYAIKNGYAESEITEHSVIIEPPSAPTVALESASKVAQCNPISIKWDHTPETSGYKVIVNRNGEFFKEEDLGTKNSYVLETTDVATYTFNVIAYNDKGDSELSNNVSVQTMSPCTVTFLDHDGRVIAMQSVAYATSASKPPAPTRKGHTFDGWNDGFSNITSDITVTAEYSINYYNVEFIDYDGTMLKDQSVQFEASVTPPTNPTYPTQGYGFIGWRLEEGAGDYLKVEENLTYRATYSWTNQNIHVISSILSAVRDANNNSKYTVRIQMDNHLEDVVDGKLLVNLKTAEGKMVATSTTYVSFNAATGVGNPNTFIKDVDVIYSGVATVCEAILLNLDLNGKTGGIFAEAVSANISSENQWSDWSYTYPTDATGKVETATEYREKNREFTTSTEYPYAGWEHVDTEKLWGNWSGWVDYSIASSDTRDVETRQSLVSEAYSEYRYKRHYSYNCSKGYWSHFCTICAKQMYGGTWSTTYSPWSTTTYPTVDTQRCGHEGTINIVKIGGKSYYQRYSRTIDAVYKTQYRYRDSYNMYHYQKWTEWSEWKNEVIIPTTTKSVELRNKYRYETNVNPAGEDNSGELYTTSGNISIATDNLVGKKAVIMVYQGNNTDPTYSQLQYIGETVICENNSYDFSYKTKTPISADTGDYIVTLGIEGATNLINVDRIAAPAITYNATFVDYDGSIISSFDVEEEHGAMLPENPSREGYNFIKWDRSSNCVTRDLTVNAVYEPKKYVVVYVDWVKGDIQILEQEHNTLLEPPENAIIQGYTFVGWDKVIDGNNLVTGHTIATAIYEAIEYTVEFMNPDGSSTAQIVKYGGSAILPEDLAVEDDYEFLGWSNESSWWNVVEDMQVYPIIVYKENTMAPLAKGDTLVVSSSAYVDLLSEDGAQIYYTLDGTEPTLESNVYSEPIYVNGQDAQINAIAKNANKNLSDVTTIDFIYNEESSESEYEVVVLEANDEAIKADTDVKIQLSLDQPMALSSYEFFIKTERDISYIDFDHETLIPKYESGVASQSGELIIEPYGSNTWQVLWYTDAPQQTSGELLTLYLTTINGIEYEKMEYSIWYKDGAILDENGEGISNIPIRGEITSLIADVVKDQQIDLLDLTILAQNYGVEDSEYDINNDNIVNLYDLIHVAYQIE